MCASERARGASGCLDFLRRKYQKAKAAITSKATPTPTPIPTPIAVPFDEDEEPEDEDEEVDGDVVPFESDPSAGGDNATVLEPGNDAAGVVVVVAEELRPGLLESSIQNCPE